MNNYDLVMKGKSVYPSIDNKCISIVLKIDMENDYKNIIDTDISFKEFIERLKSDEDYRKEVLEIIKEYYGFNNLKLITNSSYDKWYFVNYKNINNDCCSLNYVIKVGSLNTYSMMDDYTDLFNNKIIYKTNY